MRKTSFAPAILGATLCLSGLAATSPSAADSSAPSASSPLGARIVTRAGAPWLHVGGQFQDSRTTPTHVDPEARARAIVTRISAAAQRSTLTATTVDRFGDGDTIVRFEQEHRGLPVIGRGAAVRMSASGAPLLTMLDVEASLPANVTPSLSAAEAARAAARFSPLGADASDAHLVVWSSAKGARLAWAVLPKIPTGLPTAPRVIVDASSGAVIESRDLVRFASAKMFKHNPLKTPTLETLELPMTPDGATLSNAFLKASNCVDNKTVKPVSFFGFKMSVHVCDLMHTAKANASGDYVYAPADEPGTPASKKDEFSELSMYFHTARAYEFFRGLQGEPNATIVRDKPLQVVANLQIPAGAAEGNLAAAGDPDKPLSPFQNAFFAPAGGQLGALFQQLYGFESGALWFGQGPKRDYAYDGDVVYHEFGHAVVDATLQLGFWHVDERGAIDAPGAMNEGLADYFSSAITGDPDVGEYAATDLTQGSSAVIRTLDNNDACPTAIIGEVHYDSTLFSGALWSARTSLPEGERSKFDAALYKAMRTNAGDGDLGYDDLAKLFLATLGTDMPAGATALETAMTKRGILPGCDRVIAYAGKPIKAPHPGLGGFASPGTPTVSVGDFAPGIIQIKAGAKPGVNNVTVTFTGRSGSAQSASPIGGGGQAAPFTPVILAKAGAPITWSTTGSTPHDADVTKPAPASADKTTYTAKFELTVTTGNAIYVQIANTGETDGAYDSIKVDVESLTGAPPAEEPSDPSGTTSPELLTREVTGCACTTPGRSGGGRGTAPLAGAFAIVAAAAIGAARRVRRRTSLR